MERFASLFVVPPSGGPRLAEELCA